MYLVNNQNIMVKTCDETFDNAMKHELAILQMIRIKIDCFRERFSVMYKDNYIFYFYSVWHTKAGIIIFYSLFSLFLPELLYLKSVG